MSTVYESLLDRILPDVPGCPRALMRQAAFEAADEFCASSLLWRADLPPLDIQAERERYILTPPDGALIAMVVSVRVAGRPLRPATEDVLNAEHPGWASSRSKYPSRYLLPRASELRLAPVPTDDLPGALQVRAALRPAPGAAGPDGLPLDEWAGTIAHGARARLMEMPGKTWTNADGAVWHSRRFTHGLARARQTMRKGRSNATLTAQVKVFG